ncbi:unnamed protein product [Rhodiola kirilowii]
MEAEASWISHILSNPPEDSWETKPLPKLNHTGNEEVSELSLDVILPDDLLERILTYLPIASIFRAGSVCKKWHEITSSKRFLRYASRTYSRKPWYFMFTSSDEPIGYAYDPILRKWHGIELPCINTSNLFIASSGGLVCFLENDSRSQLYVCNPITKEYKTLQKPSGLSLPDYYSALSVSVNRRSDCYNVLILRSKPVPGNFSQWKISIHVYYSSTMMWATSLMEVLTGWRGGDECVICNGVLYFLIYSTGGGLPESRHGLITYNLSNKMSTHGTLMKSFIPVPCSLTCGRLMNLKSQLIMVGGIGKPDRPDIIKGIGIWLLKGKDWQEISRMPHRYFQGFGEFDDVFASSGTDDIIYIQSYGGPGLVVFNMHLKQWKWSQKCPVSKKFPLQLFTGFCFEPRLDISP